MKARELKNEINGDGYIICECEKYIAIGTSLCHDLISIDKSTFKISYALDTFKKGKDSINNEVLMNIWNKLEELISNDKIKYYIEGEDNLNVHLPVFTFDYDGNVIGTMTDEYGWPNVTIDGKLMHDNTYFKTREEAKNKAIREYEAGLSLAKSTKERLQEQLENIEKEEKKYLNNIKKLTKK